MAGKDVTFSLESCEGVGSVCELAKAIETNLAAVAAATQAAEAAASDGRTIQSSGDASSDREQKQAEVELQEALRQSDVEELQREGRDVQEALMRSKADAWSADGVALSRLTFHSPEIALFLLDSHFLAGCRSRVESAGCEVRPPWANGALLLVPVTEEQIDEADIQLKPHNIVMLNSDVELVAQALAQLPRRKRPQLKPECHAEDKPLQIPTSAGYHPSCSNEIEIKHSTSSQHGGEDQQIGTWMQDVGLIVERTFLNFRLANEVSEASTMVQSAPAAGAAPPEPAHMNPHRWRLPIAHAER